MLNKRAFVILLMIVVCSYQSNVIELNSNNFDNIIKQYDSILIKFYAPWCGHCKKLEPEFKKAALILKESQSNSVLGSLDCTENKDICNKYDIKGYPTLLYFKNGKSSIYNGERTADGIIFWLNKINKLTSKEVQSSDIQSIRENIKNNEIIVILLGDQGLQDYLDIVSSYDQINFYHCIQNDCFENENKTNGTVLVFKSNNYINSYSSDFSHHQLHAFIDNEATPPITPMNRFVYHSITKNDRKVILVFYNNETESIVSNLIHILALLINREVQIVVSKTEESSETTLINTFKLVVDHFPLVVILSTIQNKHYKYYYKKDNLDANEIYDFYKQFKKGMLQNSIKSEPIPLTQNEYIVKLVGLTFDNIVNDQTKDVLVKYYSPQCNYSIKIASLYEELAKQYSTNKNLIIAEINILENELDFEVETTPMFLFWPAAMNKKPILYRGERTIKDFSTFIEHNRSLKDKETEREAITHNYKEKIETNKDDL